MPRTYLNEQGYNYKSFNKIKDLLSQNTPVEHLIVSHRDPIKRMTSSFVNKFLIRGKKGLILPFNQNKLEGFAIKFLDKFHDISLKTCNQADSKSPKDTAIMRFSLESFIATAIHKSINRKKLNGHFAPQIINKSQWETYESLVSASTNVYPLRVENFDSDLGKINRSMGLENFLPDKKNSTNLPDSQWQFSSGIQASRAKIQELCEQKIIPKSSSLEQLLDTRPWLHKNFKKVFRYDYILSSYFDNKE